MVNKVENIITVINYIENNLTEKLNLSSIAMGVGYSKYHLQFDTTWQSSELCDFEYYDFKSYKNKYALVKVKLLSDF